MDESTLLILRIFGYLLNIAIFAATILKYPHHRVVLGAWLIWISVVTVAVLFRFVGRDDVYVTLVDYVVTVLLYVCAVCGAWVYLSHNGRHK